ncbi:MAG: regulatory protein RecX [Ruminococcaceae bacterium]|nr:regulatory protein RecX [Oscillospiraceae bacterium]
MKITKMLRQRGRIYKVLFDDDTYINVDVSLAEQKNLAVGKEISEEESFNIEDESERIRCTSRALYYLGRSGYTRKGLTEKLIKAGFKETFVFATVKRMEELSYIDDGEYGKRLVARCNEMGISQRETLNRLIKSGINTNTAKEISSNSFSDEQDKIRRLIKKKYADKLSSPELVKKTFAALQRRGFFYADIRAVLKEFDERIDSGEYDNG